MHHVSAEPHTTGSKAVLLVITMLTCCISIASHTGVLCSRLRRSKSAKLVVFFSNCDSVDFHHQLLLHQQQGGDAVGDADESDLLLGASPVLKLHGDMRQPERTSSLVTFAKVLAKIMLVYQTLGWLGQLFDVAFGGQPK